MAQSFTTADGVLVIPGAYADVNVQNTASGLATTGVLMLVGEADAGPRFNLETDLEDTAAYGPDQGANVIAKYKSGNLVDAYRAAANPANDEDIRGAPGKIILVKTNSSVKATGALTKQGGGTYAYLADRNYGDLGNLIYFEIAAATSEVLPTTGATTYIPPVGTTAYGIRVNGAASVGGTLSANTQPDALVTALDGLTGVAASGGVNRGILTVSGTLLLTANPGGAGARVIEIERSVNWAVAPVAGDTLIIPAGSVIAGGSSQNVGAYVITTVGAATLRATKLSDAGAGGAVPGTITSPATVSPAATIVAVTDASAWSPVTITQESGDPIDGVGRSLEIAQLTSGTDLLERTFFQLATTSAVVWVSKTGAAKLLVSGAEYKANAKINRQLDSVNETLTAGGEIALKVGYIGTTATITVTSTTLTTTVTGGSGGNLSLNLAQFPTLSDLATYVTNSPGYTCAIGTATLGQLPPTALDEVSGVGICSTFGAQVGRIKIDAYRFFNKIQTSSVLVQVNDPVDRPDAGLPKVTSAVAYLTGGSKGGSATADFTAAIDALELVKGNFLVPLISRDATADIADGLTANTSTYVVDDVNAYARSHVLAMSKLKKKRNRQCILSKNGSFTEVKDAAANIASARAAMTFQDFKNANSTGSLVQFQSWMGAVLAAGMQLAGLYKAIFNKGINTSGVVMRDGSFSDKNDSQIEDALSNGLLVARAADTGGFRFVSDQTTYGKDNNFVWNSIQAIYVLDVVAQALRVGIENTFIGKTVGDTSASAVKLYIEGRMSEYLRLKLLAPSDDAPKGYKNLVVQIAEGAILVNCEIKPNGALYFAYVSLLASSPSQTA